MEIWEVAEHVDRIEGLTADGKPDPDYAASLGLKEAPLGRRALGAGVDIVVYLLLQIPYLVFTVPLLLKLVFTALPNRAPGLMKGLVRSIAGRAQQGFVDPQIKAHADYWEAELAKSEWFAGDAMTGADIMMSFPLEAGAARGGAASRPHVKAFLDRIHARPAYQRALERGGPYAYA